MKWSWSLLLIGWLNAATSREAYPVNQNSSVDVKIARKNMETALRSYELLRFQEVTTRMIKDGYNLRGFYHTSTWRDQWKSIVEEQMLLMDGKRPQAASAHAYDKAKSNKISWGTRQWSSILDIVDGLTVNVAGNPGDLDKIKETINNLRLKGREKISYGFNQTILRTSFRKMNATLREEYIARTNLSEGEVSTFSALLDHCRRERRSGRKSLVFYIHNKGGCCSRGHERTLHVTTWRDSMNAFNIEFPSICLRSLLDGHSACGMELQDGSFSGNFWWARCDHVALLPSLWNPYDAYAVEFAIFNVSHFHSHGVEFGNKCGYSSHNFYFNHYANPSPRTSYLHRLMQLVVEPTLPFSEVLGAAQKAEPEEKIKLREENLRKCAEATSSAIPYFSRQGDNLGENRAGKSFFP